MPKTTISEAMSQNGMRAIYKTHAALVLPVSAALADSIDQSKIKTGVEAGQMLLTWTDGEKRPGNVINSDAKTDITFIVTRNDGTDASVDGTDMKSAVLALLQMKKRADEDTIRVAAANVELQVAYDDAVGRGETAAEPVMAVPEFPENAFDKVNGLVACVKERQIAIRADEFADITAKANADTFTGNLRKLTRSSLTAADQAKAEDARQIKAEIALLNPNHADAAAALMPAPYEGDSKAASDMLMALPQDPGGISAAQRSAMGSNRDFDLVKRLFSVATTTDAYQIGAVALSHTGFQTIAQELAKFENKDAGEAILPRMAAVTKDAMEAYAWQGKIYTKDGADILLMRDQYAAFAYTWDVESRVAEINVEATVLRNLTQDDVPSDDELTELRETLVALRFDNGADVNFDWDDEPEADVVEIG